MNKKIVSLAVATLCLQALSLPVNGQELAARGPAKVTVQDFELQHFLLSEPRRAAMLKSEGDVFKTIDEVLNVRTFNASGTVTPPFTDTEKNYAAYQKERASLTAALNIVERRARDAFIRDAKLLEQRARETWLQDTEVHFTEDEADITAIFFDLSKRDWKSNAERVSAALAELAAGKPYDSVAATYSDDPSFAQSRGKVAGVKLKSVDASLMKPIFTDLKVGEFSQPIAARRGLYIVRLDAKRARSKKTFESVRDTIVAAQLEEAARAARVALIESLQKTDITFNEPEINKLLPKPVVDPMKVIRDYYKQQGITVSETPK